jgi:hypothetical protein
MPKRAARTWMLVALPMMLAACSSDEETAPASGSVSVAEAFTNALDFGGQASPTVGPLPDGTTGGPTVTPLPGTEPMTVQPGAGITFDIPWQGGEISGVNLGFGGSKHFHVAVPAAGGQTSGVIGIQASLASNVCADLGDTCHQIQCYEQVVFPDGSTVSKEAAMQIVLDCTGGVGCDGGGSCGGHTQCTQYCSCVTSNQAAFDACDEALLDCDDGCYAQNMDDDAAYQQCTCDTCAPQMDACMQQLGCPALTPDCVDNFTACGGGP